MRQTNAENNSEIENLTSTPYDDAFRTMVNDCVQLLIPVINEVFKKHYTGKERVIMRPNEHFINQQDGNEQKRITDSSFSIISGDKEDKYIFECQSNADDTLLIRIFEYITQEALDSGKIVKHKLIVTIPNAAILFLRTKRTTPDAMNIVMNTPGGTVSFDIPIMKVSKYSLSEIFEKDLYFLLPFYIFNFEKNFLKYEDNESELEKLKAEYKDFMKLLERAIKDGKIFVHDMLTILEMSKRVLENIAAKHKNIRKEVKKIMGGRIIDYEGRSIFYDGIAVGEKRGRIEGRREEKFETARRLRSAGMSDIQIHQFTDLSLDDLKIL